MVVKNPQLNNNNNKHNKKLQQQQQKQQPFLLKRQRFVLFAGDVEPVCRWSVVGEVIRQSQGVRDSLSSTT